MAAIAGEPVDRLPCLPILHSGLPPIFGVPLGAFFTSAATMADVIVRGYRAFGYDGVQLSLGVTGEAAALGARIEQPAEGAPVLREVLLPDIADADALTALRAHADRHPPAESAPMARYYEAVARTVDAIGAEAFVLAMLRGPLLAASQLCGVEALLVALITAPEAVTRVLAFTTEIITTLGRWLIGCGAHGLVLGEATCSPNFISPRHYRALVLPHHRKLVGELRAAGWRHVGLHICGDVAPIMDDAISTGITFMDIDAQVPVAKALALNAGRVGLRGNLDPSSVFRFGTAADVRRATAALVTTLTETARDSAPRWVPSSGCDIPPGAPAENIRTFVGATRASAWSA
jgi:uroporphyrinogen decarboxylase